MGEALVRRDEDGEATQRQTRDACCSNKMRRPALGAAVRVVRKEDELLYRTGTENCTTRGRILLTYKFYVNDYQPNNFDLG
jgi:hypothetical protein